MRRKFMDAEHIEKIKEILKNCNNQFWENLLTEEEKEYVYNKTSFYIGDKSAKSAMVRRYYFLNDYTELKRCLGCENILLDPSKNFCSRECMRTEKGRKIIREKVKQTNLERHGTTNLMELDWVREKIKQTNLKTYGCEYASQSQEIREKVKETTLRKYGCEYASQSEEVKQKIKETNLKTWLCPNKMLIF